MIDPKIWTMPEYPAFFGLGAAYQQGVEEHPILNALMQGSMGMTPEDAGILAQMIFLGGNGNHLEIGSLFGGTAILAALIKERFDQSGTVYCVDDLEMTGKDYITSNAETFAMKNHILLVVGKSNPLPISGIFRTALIDASHDYGNALQDWLNVRNVTEKYVLFHDYDPSHNGVAQAAQVAMRDWRPVHISNHSIVLEKP